LAGSEQNLKENNAPRSGCGCARWDTLATQLADITPLEIMVSDPPTQNDVQSIVYQANAMLAAMKAA